MADTSLVFNVLAKDKASRTFDKIKGAAKLAFAAGAVAAGAFAKDAIGAASDLAETQSKVTQIFGESSQGVLDFSKGTAKSLGQSQQQALDAASTFGIFGKSAGLAGDDLVGFSTEMTGLASDMASFNNTTPQAAIDAIGAALRGEAEPMRQFGVLLDDATLRARAMEMGLTDTTKNALTPQQKVLAAQAEILAQTSDQQGDFARTSGGLANQTRIMSAQFDDFKTQLGAKLLPVVLKISTWALGAMDWMREHGSLLKTLGMILGPLVGIITAIVVISKIWTVVQTALNIVMMLNPIGLIILAIVALIAIIVLIATKTNWFQRLWKTVWGAVKTAALAVWQWIRDVLWEKGIKLYFNLMIGMARTVWNAIKLYFGFWKGMLARVIGWIVGLWNGARSGLDKLVSFVRGLPGRIIRALGNVGRMLFRAGQNIIQGLINGIGSMIQRVRDTISSVAQTVRNFLPFSPARQGPLSGAGNPFFSGQAIASLLAQGMASGVPKVSTASSKMADAAREMLAALRSGKTFFEDFSFRGASGNVGRFNDVLAEQFYGSGGSFNRAELSKFLTGVAGANRPARGAPTGATAPVRLEVSSAGARLDDLLLEVLARAIRVRGGNVQLVLGTRRG